MKTRSTEDYIKGIFELRRENESVSTSELARHLKIGDGSVTDMLKKLSGKGLIDYEPYRGVWLTEEGEQLALKMVRRHRLWEMFLVRFLGYSWDEIHDEAERLEHATSDDLEERLDRALGYPAIDPHGDPIPSASGELAGVEGRALADSDVGQRGIIVRVHDESQELLKLMTRLGLGLNTRIVVRQKLAVDGSVVIGFTDRETEIPLSPAFAQAIIIQNDEP